MSKIKNDAELYDEFSDFIRDEVRDRNHPKLSIRAFSQLRAPSITHMCIPLENVGDGVSTKLFTKVEKFRPNTMLKTEEVVETGSNQFVAYVPFNNSDNDDDDEPKKKKNRHTTFAFTPQLVVVGYFILIIIALVKTDMRQWEYFLQ